MLIRRFLLTHSAYADPQRGKKISCTTSFLHTHTYSTQRGENDGFRGISDVWRFPIVTTHWWPKTQNERFVWENEQYLYRFLPLVHNYIQVKWVRTHIRCVTCVCARSGSRLTEGVSEAWCWGNCHRSCRFWTVYSRIMRTYFKQTRLLSSLYLYTSAPCIRFIHLEPGTVYWDMTPTRKKKKESYYDEGLVHE